MAPMAASPLMRPLRPEGPETPGWELGDITAIDEALVWAVSNSIIQFSKGFWMNECTKCHHKKGSLE
jgi:hypothetical protein